MNLPLRSLSILLLLLAGCGGSEEPDLPASEGSPVTGAAPTGAEPAATLSSRLASDIDSLVSAGGTGSRVVFTRGNDWSVDFIARRFAAAGARVEIDTFAVRGGNRGSLANVVGTIPGRSDSTVVICAHLDASASRDRGWQKSSGTMPAPGAVDNASGVAALMEIIALVHSDSTPPRHTLLFIACNAEEKNPRYAGHHLGSQHAARQLKKEGRNISAVISIDMAGYSPRGNHIGLFASSNGQRLARRLAALKDSLGVEIDLPQSFGPCRNSDNESFEQLGYPTVLFMESCKPWRGSAQVPRNPGYHTAKDLPGLVNRDVLEGVVRVVAGFVR